MRRLTDDQWFAIRQPFSFLRSYYVGWSAKHRFIVSTWLEQRDGGWFYETDDAVIFESSTDALAFKVWISADPFGLARRVRPQVADAMALFELD
jgi:hypothetical protein